MSCQLRFWSRSKRNNAQAARELLRYNLLLLNTRLMQCDMTRRAACQATGSPESLKYIGKKFSDVEPRGAAFYYHRLCLCANNTHAQRRDCWLYVRYFEMLSRCVRMFMHYVMLLQTKDMHHIQIVLSYKMSDFLLYVLAGNIKNYKCISCPSKSDYTSPFMFKCKLKSV